LKDLKKGYNFALDLTLIKAFHKKLWASKVARVPILKIVRPLTWESWEKHHLDVALVACYREYYQGEGVGFP
jgi:hypothetical protein